MRNDTRDMMRVWRENHTTNDQDQVVAAIKFLVIFFLVVGAIIAFFALAYLFVFFPRPA